MQLVLNSMGLCLKVRNGSFWIRGGSEERIIGPARISSILVTHNCLLSSAALMLAVANGVPVHIIGRKGEQTATVCSAAYSYKAAIRQAQVALTHSSAGTKLVIACLRLKTEGLVRHLQLLCQKSIAAPADVNGVVASMRQASNSMDAFMGEPLHRCVNRLMGLEGAISAQYWPLAGACLPAPFTFIKRGRRPAPDAGNAVFNYAYALLYALAERALHAAGLDAWLGLLHKARPGRPALVYDCIEPFRPWVNEWLTDALTEGLVKPAWIEQTLMEAKGRQWLISREGRAALITGFNGYFSGPLTWEGKTLSRHDHVFSWCAGLAKNILAAYEEDAADAAAET